MKNLLILFISFCFAFANVYGQEFPKPNFPSPENAFYMYLDNESISDPSKYNGKVKKVIRTLKEYNAGITSKTIQKETMFVNTNGELEKTVLRTYSFGLEDSKEETNHLETPKAIVKTVGNRTVKIIKNEISKDEFEDEYNEKGDDYYVYENDRLTTFYNKRDSISYVYDAKNRLVEIKMFESSLTEEYNDEDGSITLWRSDFEDRALQRITYENGRMKSKELYDKYGEVIEVYKTNYTYSADNLMKEFQTVYTRYLFDYYESSIAIEKQKYEEFPVVEMNDSIRTGIFDYSDKNKIRSYNRKIGDENETYKITYDSNNRMHMVTGNLQFYQQGNLQQLEVEYEYLYDEKGNPSTIKSYYFIGGKKIIDKETTFEIEYY